MLYANLNKTVTFGHNYNYSKEEMDEKNQYLKQAKEMLGSSSEEYAQKFKNVEYRSDASSLYKSFSEKINYLITEDEFAKHEEESFETTLKGKKNLLKRLSNEIKEMET